MNKQVELNREYWGRVINMCQGTALEGREWKCVKYDGEVWSNISKVRPDFDDDSEKYELAVAVVEDKAVFYGDELYLKDGGEKYIWSAFMVAGWDNWTWQKPEPKRTFLLNGVELPCPVENHEGNWYIQINGKTYWFKMRNDQELVRNTLINLLNEAKKHNET